MLSYENSLNSDIYKKESIENWRSISDNIIDPDIMVDEEAHRLQRLGIKDADSLHIACSIIGKCDYFITTDKGILKKKNSIENIKVVNPLNFIEEIYGESHDN